MSFIGLLVITTILAVATVYRVVSAPDVEIQSLYIRSLEYFLLLNVVDGLLAPNMDWFAVEQPVSAVWFYPAAAVPLALGWLALKAKRTWQASR